MTEIKNNNNEAVNENTENTAVAPVEGEKKENGFLAGCKKVWNSKPVTIIKKVAVPVVAAAVGFVGGVILSNKGGNSEEECEEYEEYSDEE